MFGSSVLEVAIGVVFVYLLLGLICSVINEGIATLINKRGDTLFLGVKNLLSDPEFIGLAQQVYTHGLVAGISQHATNAKRSNRLPSYMPSNTFSLTLLDILSSQGAAETWGGEEIVAKREKELQEAMAKASANPTDVNLQEAQKNAENALSAVEAEIVAEREKELEKAMAEASANPTDVNLQEAQKNAENALRAAKAREAHTKANKVAKDVKNPKDFEKLEEAARELAKALALGRGLAAEFPDPLGNIEKAVVNLPDGNTKESLLVMLAKTKRDCALVANEINTAEFQLKKLQENIEDWFGGAMKRVGGWYKRWTGNVLLVIATLLVFAANADTFMLVERFSRDSALRASVVVAAENAVQNRANGGQGEQVQEEIINQARQLGLPFGWTPEETNVYTIKQVPRDLPGWLLKLLGLLVSVCAVSLGAPFWFDTLSKFVNVRGAGTPPGEPKRSAPLPKES